MPDLATGHAASAQRLVVFSGLPGTGKTSLAEAVGRTYGLPVFSVAWAIGALAPFGFLDRENRGPVAYALLTMLARRQLDLGQSAVLDGMCGQESIREQWRRLAGSYSAAFVSIECVCSDARLHRWRIEARDERIPGWPDPGWEHVTEMKGQYEPWRLRRLVIDAVKPLDENVVTVLRHLEGAGSEHSG
jgi:predicted kinase